MQDNNQAELINADDLIQIQLLKNQTSRNWIWLIIKIILLRIPLTIGLLLIIVLLGIFITKTGLRTACTIVEDYLPGIIQIAEIDGRLLDHLKLRGFQLKLAKFKLTLGALDLNWSPGLLINGVLSIQHLAIRDLDFTLTPSPTPVHLPKIMIPLRLDLNDLNLERVRFFTVGNENPRFILDRAIGMASLNYDTVQITRCEIVLTQPQLAIQTTGRIILKDQYPLALRISWNLTPRIPLAGKAKLTGDLNFFQIQQNFIEGLTGELTAQVQNVLVHPSWNGSLKLQKVNVPAWRAGLPEIDLNGHISTSGDVKNINVTGKLNARAATWPELGHSTFDFNLNWRDRALELNSLIIKELGSNRMLITHGQLDFNNNQLVWNGAFNFTDLDPGKLLAKWPGRLNGRVITQGSWNYHAGLDFGVELLDLKGNLRDLPITASGKLLDKNMHWQLVDFNVRSGATHLQLNGQLKSDQVNPQLEGTVQLDNFKLGNQSIETIKGVFNTELTGSGRFTANLDGKNLSTKGVHWESLTLRGEGTRLDHRITLKMLGKPLGIKLIATGSLNQLKTYALSCSDFNLTTTEFGQWQLTQAMPLNFNFTQPELALGPICLRNEKDSYGCIQVKRSISGMWDAKLDIPHLSSELFNNQIFKQTKITGFAQIHGQLQFLNPFLTGMITTEIPQGKFQVFAPGGKIQDFNLARLKLILNANRDELSAKLNLPSNELGEITSELHLPHWNLDNPQRSDQVLRGSVRAKLPGLAKIAALFPEITNPRGWLNADLTLGGTLGAPKIQGSADLQEINFTLAQYALKIQNFQITAHGNSTGILDLKGTGLIGNGQVILNGTGMLANGEFKAKLQGKGQRLKIINSKEYLLIISPNLEFKLDPKIIELTGEIQIPEARIRPHALPPGTITPSPDVIFANQITAHAKSTLPMLINLNLSLGDEVMIDAFGVRGRLTGDLTVQREGRSEILGTGQLQVIDGEYRLSSGFRLAAKLGAPLTITQGRLVYANSPLNNPGLVLQAERTGSDLTAGVQILGTLKDPKLAFFAENNPGLTQAEITKYLLTGIAPAANDHTSERGLAVGAYVAPKVYLEYENSLGSTPNQVRLRYDLSKHLEFQTETGEGHGADIFLKFEH